MVSSPIPSHDSIVNELPHQQKQLRHRQGTASGSVTSKMSEVKILPDFCGGNLARTGRWEVSEGSQAVSTAFSTIFA
jgi:hypothetical protein